MSIIKRELQIQTLQDEVDYLETQIEDPIIVDITGLQNDVSDL